VHKRAAQAPIDNRSVASYFVAEPSDKGTCKVAAEELVFAYHTAKHGLSVAAADCTSKLISELFEKRYSNGKTKTFAIVKNVSLR